MSHKQTSYILLAYTCYAYKISLLILRSWTKAILNGRTLWDEVKRMVASQMVTMAESETTK